MYESPIELIYNGINTKIENGIVSAVLNIGIRVNKGELIKALRYDRDMYQNGYIDGRKSVFEEDLMYDDTYKPTFYIGSQLTPEGTFVVTTNNLQGFNKVIVENGKNEYKIFYQNPAEVRHGKWISDEDGNICCSVCGRDGVGESFCEHCGADMREEKDERNN